MASDLKRLAVDNQCVVVVINHEASKNRPSLGRYWWHVPHLRLHSQRLSAGRFQLTVVGSVYGPPGPQRCCFELSPATWKQSHRRTRWNSTLAAVSASIREQSGRWPFFFYLSAPAIAHSRLTRRNWARRHACRSRLQSLPGLATLTATFPVSQRHRPSLRRQTSNLRQRPAVNYVAPF